MSSNNPRRRFIAGAVCPRCAALDKIIVDLATDRRECVACGFTEARPGDQAADQAGSDGAPGELSTRVSRPAARRVETAAVPVRLVDPLEK